MLVPLLRRLRVDFAGGQHGGRLIQNQDLRIPVERFQDFDALLFADGQLRNLAVGIQIKVKLVNQTFDAGVRLFSIDQRSELRFCPGNDIV